MKIDVIDSHTGGEPTRVVMSGGPDLGDGSLDERLSIFRKDFDHFRSAIVNEPRGSDTFVGALLCHPMDPSCSAGVIFFNNIGYLGMCGHGSIGVMATLRYAGRIEPGIHRIETPVGPISAELHQTGEVTIGNVASYRYRASVRIEAGSHDVVGDVAWGGNWFFLAHQSPYEIELRNVDLLTDHTEQIKRELNIRGITGENGAEIDHIELYGPPTRTDAHSKNFVLCPGGAYDRSACGTGTSAKMACLYADGKLRPGETWVQESITGTVFKGHIEISENRIYPFIKGEAFVNAQATIILNDRDPFCWGIRA